MKKNIFLFLAAAVVLVVVAIACKRNFNNEFEARGTNAGNGPFLDTVTLPAVITINRTLSRDTLYILNGKTYVDSLVTLTIQAGGRIEAKKKGSNDSASALIITRGARLYAEGTSTNPIHFTSNETSPQSGDWGGVVLLGKAPLNSGDLAIEGVNLLTVPPGINVNYGGGGAGLGDPMDCSGKLTYCLIEYAGVAIALDNELNGLTCGGVGAGTILDFIEVYKGNDDAFQFFGGTVNAKHLFAYVPDDDAFEFNSGYTGKIQFAVSVLNTTENYSANPNGIESQNNGSTPLTRPVLSNLTIIGLNNSLDATIKGLLNGTRFGNGSDYILRNSIVMGYPTGINVANGVNVNNCLVHGFNTAGTGLPVTNILYQSTVNTANSYILLHNPFGSTPDFRPDAISPALSLARDFTGLPSTAAGGACSVPAWSFTTSGVNYVGAFGAYNSLHPGINNWLFGWARY